MLTVWSVCVGDGYPTSAVLRLQHQVAKNLPEPHQFVCITDRQIDSVQCIPPLPGLPGWWQKLSLFRGGFATGPNLYLDLDVIITGDLSALVNKYRLCDLAAPRNWAQSGHDSVQSSVMIWRGENDTTLRILREFDFANAHWPPINRPGVLWGDQEWITELLGKPGEGTVTAIDPALVKSYKYHCRAELPAGVRVVVFHGEPKPEAVDAAWIREAWA